MWEDLFRRTCPRPIELDDIIVIMQFVMKIELVFFFFFFFFFCFFFFFFLFFFFFFFFFRFYFILFLIICAIKSWLSSKGFNLDIKRDCLLSHLWLFSMSCVSIDNAIMSLWHRYQVLRRSILLTKKFLW